MDDGREFEVLHDKLRQKNYTLYILEVLVLSKTFYFSRLLAFLDFDVSAARDFQFPETARDGTQWGGCRAARTSKLPIVDDIRFQSQ